MEMRPPLQGRQRQPGRLIDPGPRRALEKQIGSFIERLEAAEVLGHRVAIMDQRFEVLEKRLDGMEKQIETILELAHTVIGEPEKAA